VSGHSLLRSFSGGALAGTNLVRLIYVDEAGTSPAEPVRVVASVIVDGDSQWKLLTDELNRIVEEYVPEPVRKGFVVHAKEIFGGGRQVDRSVWGFDDRLRFLKLVLGLPAAFNVPIAVGIVHTGFFLD
jgi:hypothetical protein